MTNFLMPKFGLTMEEGTVTEWLVQAGDSFQLSQSLVEIETKTKTSLTLKLL